MRSGSHQPDSRALARGRMAASGGGAIALAPAIIWTVQQFGMDMTATAAAGFAAAIGWLARTIETAVQR